MTNSNFFDQYKNNEFVRGLCFQSVDYLLTVHEEMYEDSLEVHDWTPLFMTAREYTPHDYIREFLKDADKDDIHEAHLEYDGHQDADLLQDDIIRIIGAGKRTYILDSGDILLYE